MANLIEIIVTASDETAAAFASARAAADALGTSAGGAAADVEELDAATVQAGAGAEELAAGAEQGAAGAEELGAGAAQATAGVEELGAGAEQAAAGAEELGAGAAQASAGVEELGAAAAQAGAGAAELGAGAEQIGAGAAQAGGAAAQGAAGVAELGAAAAATTSLTGGAVASWEDLSAAAAGLGAGAGGAVAGIEELGAAAAGAEMAAGSAAAELEQLGGAATQAGVSMGSAGQLLGVGMVAVIAVLIALIPELAGLFLGLGASLASTVLGVGAIVLGWQGLADAAHNLMITIEPLRTALSNIFRSDLSAPFAQLGKDLTSLTPEFSGLAHAIADVIRAMLPAREDVDQLGRAVNSAAQFFQNGRMGASAFMAAMGAMADAAGPSMGKIGAAVSNFFVLWFQDVQKLSADHTLQNAFDAAAKAIDAADRVFVAFSDVLTRIAAQAGPAMARVLNDIADFLERDGDKIAHFMEGLANLIDLFLHVVEVIEKVEDALGPIGEIFMRMLNPIKAVIDAINAVAEALSRIGGSLPHFASGGITSGGFATGGISSKATGGIDSGLTMVGENGPELVSLPGGSHISSNSSMATALGGGGGGGGGAFELVTTTGADAYVATMISGLIRSGKLQIRRTQLVGG
jgi:methyl-accepting chemotaxis protein